MKLFLCLLILLSAPVLKAQEEPIVLKTTTGDIFGSLLLPTGGDKVPVVLIISGSGPTDRNGNNPQMKNNSLKMLAEGLQKSGFASLRFDKRGIAQSVESGKAESDLLFEDYVSDVQEWVKLLSADKRFSRIIIAGHSEGSLIGMLASINNPSVSQYISLAGAGYPAGKLIIRQLSTQPEPIKKMIHEMTGKLEKGDTIVSVPPFLHSLFRRDIQPYLISWFKYDPAKEIAKLKIPVLIVQGTTDIQITKGDAEALATANPKAHKLVIENMNHVLKKCQGTDMQAQIVLYTNPDIPLHAELMKNISAFIKDAK